MQRKWERSAGGRDRDERARDSENGQRGQNGRGVINEGRVQDGWMRGGAKREKECEAAVYLPNKLDRISSIIKERDGENTDTHTHRCTKASLCLAHNTHPPSLTHLQINTLTYDSEVLNPRLSARQLSPRSAACEPATCAKAPNRPVDLRLVSDSPQPLAGAHAT